MIRTRQEACAVLGVSALANEAEIKSAYKSLIKIYHPDANPNRRQSAADIARYNEIVEAYEFMMREFSAAPNSSGKIYGSVRTGASSFVRSSPSRDDHEAWEKRYSRYQQQKKDDFIKKQEEYKQEAEIKRQEELKAEETYNKAMDAIRAIQTAEALRAWIKASDDHR